MLDLISFSWGLSFGTGFVAEMDSEVGLIVSPLIDEVCHLEFVDAKVIDVGDEVFILTLENTERASIWWWQRQTHCQPL